ncbi:MATE efflux family protein [Halorhabdus tiamatea SARL4B]|uniref:MATE efflux family protein n=2 Tax=Halorhabdus tiamatea SARL4B TaxID=1033806 RepID=U2F8I4_9EURY|nr:MATE family efflux transporter [Halorhabdus tiamatea]ERJ06425.1 MATE efflux family protein [Halorhabdus tiamatea SARL4B]
MDDSGPQTNVTEGGLLRPMLDIAWPLVVFQLLNVAYNVTDTIWLGHYSADAVGALSIAWPLVFLFISVAGGFNSAGAILVAQYTGADSEGSAGKVTGNQLTFVIGMAAILGVLGFLLSGQLLALLPSSAGTTERIIPMANDYMEIFYLGLPFLFTFFVFSTVMRGYGDTKTPMYVMAGSVALNVVIDPILIFGFAGNPLFAPPGLDVIGATLADLTSFSGLGIGGAALATVSSRGLAAVVGIGLLFFGGYGPDVRIKHLWPDLEVIRKIVDLGLPTTAEQSAAALGQITMTAMVSMFSPAVVAAYGLTNRIGTIVFLPSMGLGRATNTMVGQNLGAEKPDRAERATWVAAKAAVAVLLIAAVVAFVFPEPIVGVFLGTGTEEAAITLAFAATYLQVRAVEFGFMGLFQVILGAFRGAGNTRTAMVLSIIALWLGRVPLVYLLAVNPGFLNELGIWIGFAAGDIIGGIVAVLWFTRGTWKEAVIEKAGPDDGEPPPGEADAVETG